MKPLTTESRDNHSLAALGRASVQIVHDLKNQLNGLKLYATFLRKRMEKTERPKDELDTIKKLIAGLDRTAEDLSMISEYGQPLQLRTQPGIDLQAIIAGVAKDLNTRLSATPKTTGALAGPIIVATHPEPLTGEFDHTVLSDALKSISNGALRMMNHKARDGALNIGLKGDSSAAGRSGLIEWEIGDPAPNDIFHSFAGTEAIRMSLAARVIEGHGGSAECDGATLRVRLPLAK